MRDQSFLFVQSKLKDEATGEFPSALYSKPDDLWNIHDVSGEYPEAAEELASALVSLNP